MAKVKKIKSKEEIVVNFKGVDIKTTEGIWTNAGPYIKYPVGTEFELIEENNLSVKVEIDFNDFITGKGTSTTSTLFIAKIVNQ